MTTNTTLGMVYRFESKIPDLVLFLVITVATGSFLLSYVALMEAATRAGIPSFLAPAFPLTVDAFLAIGTLTILRNSLRKESTLKGWTVLVSFTLVSIGLNVAVGEYTPLSIVCHALPPAALAISLELFTGFISSDLTRRPVMLHHDAPVHEPVTDPSPVQVSEPEPITPHAQENLDESVTIARSQGPSDGDIVLVFRENPGITMSAAAEMLGCHRTTVSRRVKSLVERGLLDRETTPGYLLSIKTSEPIQTA
ncbi:hypothetical protein DSECCO2_99730 [anaerobic digester metagenome]